MSASRRSRDCSTKRHRGARRSRRIQRTGRRRRGGGCRRPSRRASPFACGIFSWYRRLPAAERGEQPGEEDRREGRGGAYEDSVLVSTTEKFCDGALSLASLARFSSSSGRTCVLISARAGCSAPAGRISLPPGSNTSTSSVGVDERPDRQVVRHGMGFTTAGSGAIYTSACWSSSKQAIAVGFYCNSNQILFLYDQ